MGKEKFNFEQENWWEKEELNEKLATMVDEWIRLNPKNRLSEALRNDNLDGIVAALKEQGHELGPEEMTSLRYRLGTLFRDRLGDK